MTEQAQHKDWDSAYRAGYSPKDAADAAARKKANGHDEDAGIKGEGTTLRANPFNWRAPQTIAPRRFVYGRHLIRGYVSCTIAAGGTGKSSLVVTDALALATGRCLREDAPCGRLKVWIINLEDPLEEIERRIGAAMLHYEISPSGLDGSLFVNSGRDTALVLGHEKRDGLEFDEDLIARFKSEIRARRVDVLYIAPLVLTHALNENDNVAMAALMRRLAEIAEQTSTAIDLVHHTRKIQAGQTEVSAEDGRGASAIISAARSARVLNIMSKEDADKAGIEQAKRFGFIRIDSAKRNLAPPPEAANWCRLLPIDLGNGIDAYTSDSVGVCAPWTWPDTLAGLTAAKLLDVQREVDRKNYRQNPQATNWVGFAVGRVLGLNPNDKTEKQRILAAINLWLKSGALVIGEARDSNRTVRPIIEVGQWAI